MVERRETCVHSDFDQREPRPRLGMLAKRSYRVAQGRLVPDGARAPIFTTPQLRKVNDAHQLVHENDLYAFQKPLTDVLVIGSAHSIRGAVTEIDTSVIVGPVTKRVRVTGNRRLRVRADGSLSSSAPEPFEQMPIAWTRAYGGRDQDAERILVPDRDAVLRRRRIPVEEDRLAIGTYAYPRNRLGCGFRLDLKRSRLDGTPLPNLSDPDDTFSLDRMLAKDPSDWIDRPAPAAYAPIDAATYPRCVHCGIVPVSPPPTRPIRELALGGLLVKDLERSLGTPRDPRAYNCAPPGMAIARLAGGERVQLWNLHRNHEVLEFELPREKPRLLIEPPNTRMFELEPVLGTVLIEPDDDRVTLTWTGSMTVAGIYPKEMCDRMRHAAIWS